MNGLIMQYKNLKKLTQMKSITMQGEEIIKMNAEINGIETKT